MSHFRPVVLVCDVFTIKDGKCGRKFISGESLVKKARAQAAKEGWDHLYDPGSRDRCPIHNPGNAKKWRH